MTIARAALLFVIVFSGCDPRLTTIGAFRSDAGSRIDASTTVDATPPPRRPADASLGRYIEAESGMLSGGFVVGDDVDASGGRYIHPSVGQTSEDTAGPARARYDLDATEAGTYHVWGRIHAPDISENRLWIQVDEGEWFKWRITTGDEWYWDAFHDNVNYGVPIDFEFFAGAHQLTVANSVDGIGLDRLYYAPDRSAPEGSGSACNPPHSIELGGSCNPSCGSQGGSCSGLPCQGLASFATYDCEGCCIPEQ